MAKIDKTGDAAIMPLHKILMKMCGQTGYTPDAVFEGLLDYIIGYLNPSLTPEPIEGWKFKPQDTATFHEMMQTVFRIYSEEIPRRRWSTRLATSIWRYMPEAAARVSSSHLRAWRNVWPT